MRIAKPLLFLAACIAPAAALAGDPSELLRKAEAADRNVSYRGMKAASFYFAGHMGHAALKIVHLKPDKTRTEYFSPKILAGIVLIRDGAKSWRYSPQEDTWEETGFRPTFTEGAIERGAFDNFQLRLVGTEQVAGRQTYIILAAPRSDGEAAHRLWVDKEVYLIIATEVEAPNGSVVNSSRFTTITVNPDDISPSAFKVNGKVKPVSPPSPVGFIVAKPSYLPKGYALVGQATLTVNGRSCAHLQFSNGANTISLFQRTAGGEKPKVMRSSITQVLCWKREGILYTLMGDVPSAELRKIADSIR